MSIARRIRDGYHSFAQFIASRLLLFMILAHGAWLVGKIFLLGIGLPEGLVHGSSGDINTLGVIIALGFFLVASIGVLSVSPLANSELNERYAWISRRPLRVMLVLLVLVGTVGTVGINTVDVSIFDEAGFITAVSVLYEHGLQHFFEIYELLPWLGDQHPPFPVLLGGAIFEVFGPSIIILRAWFLLFLVGSTFLTYLIGRHLYSPEIGLTGALLFLCFRHMFQITIWMGNDVPVVFFFLLALYFFLRLLESPTVLNGTALALSLGIGILTKYTMVLILPLLVGVAIWKMESTGYWLLGSAITGSLLLFGGWLALAHSFGIFAVQFERIAFLSGLTMNSNETLTAATEWRMHYRIQAIFLAIPSSMGTYVPPLLLVGLDSLKSSKRDANIFLGAWVAVVSLPIILLLPDATFLFPCYPALGLIAAHALSSAPHIRNRVLILGLVFAVGSLGFYT